MSNAVKPGDMDLSKITFSAPKNLDNGGKMIYLNYGGGINPLYVKVPEGTLPFDPNYYPDDGIDNPEKSASGKYQLTMSVKTEDNKDMESFHDVFVSLDEFIMAAAKENSQAWFKKAKISEETISELYTRQIKVSVDSETGEPNGMFPPKFNYKVVKRDGKFIPKEFMVYDKSKVIFDVNKVTDNPVEFSNVVMKGASVKTVIRCNGIWVANGKFGCTWRAEQICVEVPEGGLRDFAILSDSDEEGEDVSSVTTNAGEAPVMLEDTEEEEEDDEVEEEVKKPTPPPAEKKKVRKRVKKVKAADA
tara:strand:- start:685 stop:1596 length:912 start_codon:yes stop_codon:yes gene_type:complete